ncbi:MAG: 4'-phosphopantetheinyl transferase family protein [Paracoccaceae bacterium]
MNSTPMDLSERRHKLLRGLVSDDIAIAVTHPALNLPAPLPEEANCLSPRAVEKRRREFAAGRFAARRALKDISEQPVAIPIGPDRAPIWPKGVTGSITHTATCAAAAVTHVAKASAIGLDVEEATPLKRQLFNEILLKPEQRWADTQANPPLMAKLIFSAKEAAYKAQYTHSQQYFGFMGMETDWDLDGRSFTATFTRDAAPFTIGQSLSGRFAIGEGLILTFVELRA